MRQDKYPGQSPNSLRRTMQQRVREWKLQYGAEQEVMFRPLHQPGLRGLSDFTELKGVVVTINGRLLTHKLYHFRLEWSHWSWMQGVLGGESFSALAEGLQEALGQLGGVPSEHKTDSLRTAWKQQREDGRRELTERYAALCQHYGMQGVHNNAGRGHENGCRIVRRNCCAEFVLTPGFEVIICECRMIPIMTRSIDNRLSKLYLGA